jgi:hypothetical protein
VPGANPLACDQMTLRQRWWLDAVIVIVALAVGTAVWAAASNDAWVIRGLALGLPFAAVAGIGWGRRRWPPH